MKSAVIAVMLLIAGAHSAFAQPVAVLHVQSIAPAVNGSATVTLASGTQVTIPETDVNGPLTAQVLDGLYPSAPVVPSTRPIRDTCATNWPIDPRMRASCEQQQIKAFAGLIRRPMVTADERLIRQKCTADWPDDLERRNACEDGRQKARQQFVR